MKLKNIITAGAIGLASLLNGPAAKAHETLKHEDEYKIVLGEDATAWGAVEYVLYGNNKGSKRPIMEQRPVGETLIDSFNHTLHQHALPEYDKHKKNSQAQRNHWDYIRKIIPDKVKVGEIKGYSWNNRDTRNSGADGLPLDNLVEGDYFWIPARNITDKDLATKLDREDGCKDGVIHFKRKETEETPEKIAEEDKESTETPVLVAPPATQDATKLSAGLNGGYFIELLENQPYLEGPKFDLKLKLHTGISDNWNVAVDSNIAYHAGKFSGGFGNADIVSADATATFDYQMIEQLSAGIGPRVSLLNANINYDGNRVELTDFLGGIEADVTLDTKYVDARLSYSHNIGAGGDNLQGFNTLNKERIKAEATGTLDPFHLRIGYTFEDDHQTIRGVKRDNSDHTFEAEVSYDMLKNMGLSAGCSIDLHKGDANSTVAGACKAGLVFMYDGEQK